MTTIAQHPLSPLRPAEECQPSTEPLLQGDPRHPIYGIRDWRQARWLLDRDDRTVRGEPGPVATQNWHVVHAALVAAGVPVPPTLDGLSEVYQFIWGQGTCPYPKSLTGGGPAEFLPARHDVMQALAMPWLSKDTIDISGPGIARIADDLLTSLTVPAGDGTMLDAARYARWAALRSAALVAGIPCTPELETAMSAMFERFTRAPAVYDPPPAEQAEQMYLTTLLETGAPGLLATVLQARDRGLLTNIEAIAMVRGFLYAGTDTTGATMAALLAYLGTPDGRHWQAEARAAAGEERRRLLLSYILEIARLQPSFAQLPLFTVRAAALPGTGTVIPPLHQVMIMVPAVNRDPYRFGDDAGVFKPGRKMSLGFGARTHACDGQPLAQAMAIAIIGALLDRTTDWELNAYQADCGLVTYVSETLLACR